MDYRGARMQGPPLSSFRQRGRGNNPINHHPPPPPNQHHHPSQQPRLFTPAMNQAQWSQQNPLPPPTYNAQEEGLNYPQPSYAPDTGYKNYPFHPGSLPSPELMNSTPPPQSYPPYAPQMYIQPQVYMDPSVCFSQPPMVSTPPMVAPIDTNPKRSFHFNSKDNVTHCANCGHKNSLAETEMIKRDEQIEKLERENQVFRKQLESMMAEKAAAQLNLGQSHKSQEKEFGMSTEPQKSVNVEVPENTMKPGVDRESVSDDAKKLSQLSPDAAEFSPKPSVEAVPVVMMSLPAIAEVPVVSAKGVMDEDGDDSTPVRGSEAGTQVEENLFEKTPQVEMPDVPATAPELEASVYSPESPSEDSTSQVEHANWSDEVDKTKAQEDSSQESKTEPVNTEAPPAADSAWDEDPPVTSSAPEQNWRENNTSQFTGPTSEHWQQKGHRDRRHNNRGHKIRGQAPGFGRGKRNPNDQEPYNDNYRQNYPHNRHDNRGYHNQNFPRFQRPNDEWDNRPRDQRDAYPRQDGRNRNQRYSDRNDRHEDDHQRTSDDRESHSRERESRHTEKSYVPKYEEKNHARENKDNSRKNSWSKDRPNLENSDLKDMKESGPQGQGAWRGKDNNLNFNKEEKKETEGEKKVPRGTQNQYQGNYSNKSNRHSTTKVDPPSIVKEIPGDLFSAPGEFSLAHCVAEDFRMGSGIAVKFKTEFKRVGELLDQNVQVGGCAHLQDNNRYIFYLVTKEVSIGKPKLEDLQKSLKVMKEKCLKFGVKKLAMPRIGCGLDKLDWSRVKASINETFQDTNMEIRVYDFNVERVPEAEGNRVDGKSMLHIKYQREMQLVDIDKETALLFLGTEDGYMDPTALSLNKKHRFEQEYKKAEKTVGNVVCLNNKTPGNYDWVFSLIVAKSQNDKVLFSHIEQCCSQLSQMLRKAQFRWAGIECPQGWNDDKLFFEKILTVFRTSMSKAVELWVCFPNPDMDVLQPIKDKDNRDKDNRNKESVIVK